jgi:hypothetical protein
MGNRSSYCYGQSNYLKADELVGKSPTVTISGVEDVTFEKGLKPVLSFEGKKKGLVVNATNFDTLAESYGGFTDKWIGKQIRLDVRKVSFKGGTTNSICVTPITDAAKPAKLAALAAGEHVEMDDEIPF